MKTPRSHVDIRLHGCPRPSWLPAYRRFCAGLLEARGVRGAEVSVLLTTDAVIRHLNHKYRGLDRATDVLSFAQEAQSAVLMGQRLPLGDIVISVEAAQRGAQRFHVPVETEMRRLTTHGLLHLQGWDHGTPTERARMVGLQEKLLREVSRVAAR